MTDTSRPKASQELTAKLITVYQKGIDWAKEYEIMLNSIADNIAYKYCDESILSTAKWIRDVKSLTPQEIISAIEKEYGKEGELTEEERTRLAQAYEDRVSAYSGCGKTAVKVSERKEIEPLSNLIAEIEKILCIRFEDKYKYLSRKVFLLIHAWDKNSVLQKIKNKRDTVPAPSPKDNRRSEEAKSDLTILHEPLVRFFIKQYYPTYIYSRHRDDLHSEGMLGLYRSLMFYKPASAKFSLYAKDYILGQTYEYTSRLSNNTIHYQTQIKNYKKAISRLQNKGNTNPTNSDIAKEMNVGLEAVQRIIQAMLRVNAVTTDSEAMQNTIADDYLKAPDEVAIAKEREEHIADAIAMLPEDQQIVVNMLFYHTNDKQDKYLDIGYALAAHYNPGKDIKTLSPVKIEKIKTLRAKANRALRAELSKKGYGQSSDIPETSSLKINFFPQNYIDEEMDIIGQIQDEDEIA